MLHHRLLHHRLMYYIVVPGWEEHKAPNLTLPEHIEMFQRVTGYTLSEKMSLTLFKSDILTTWFQHYGQTWFSDPYKQTLADDIRDWLCMLVRYNGSVMISSTSGSFLKNFNPASD